MAKKMLILLYSLNLVFALLFVSTMTEIRAYIILPVFAILLFAWLCIFVILSIKNITIARKYISEGEKEKLKVIMEKIKLKSIPFWIMNFILLFCITFFAVLGTRGYLIPFVPIPILFTYIILIGTSIFSISYIRILYKNNEITFFQMIIHIILQLCFFGDIIDVLYLKYKIKKKCQMPNA